MYYDIICVLKKAVTWYSNAEGDNMYYDIGFFSEMNLSAHNCGSIKDSIVDNVSYNKEAVIKYLGSFKHFASCPKSAIDCVTGEIISPSFRLYTDGVFCWADFLAYHIEKYNIELPDKFIEHISAE